MNECKECYRLYHLARLCALTFWDHPKDKVMLHELTTARDEYLNHILIHWRSWPEVEAPRIWSN